MTLSKIVLDMNNGISTPVWNLNGTKNFSPARQDLINRIFQLMGQFKNADRVSLSRSEMTLDLEVGMSKEKLDPKGRPLSPDQLSVISQIQQLFDAFVSGIKEEIVAVPSPSAVPAAHDERPPFTKEQALSKLHNLSSLKEFSPEHICYNSHGVFVFGLEKDLDYVFYGCHPEGSALTQQEYSFCDRYRDGGSCKVLSMNREVLFERRYNQGSSLYFINNEPAIEIPWKTSR